MNKAVHELLRALEKIQDWDGTYVGACIQKIAVQESMKPDDHIPMRPIPISERLPKPYDPSITGLQDCDSTGQAWFWDCVSKSWKLRDFNIGCHLVEVDSWLPHWALPLPEVES